jgi:hypothetical protein
MPRPVGGEGGNGLLQWSQSRPCNHIYITRKPPLWAGSFTSFFIVAPIRIMRRFFVAKGKIHSDTTTLPPKPINQLLKILFYFELRISDYIRFPFGTTLYAAASKHER